jgi:hypothetical protein
MTRFLIICVASQHLLPREIVTALRLVKRDCGRRIIQLLWGGACFTDCAMRNCSVVNPNCFTICANSRRQDFFIPEEKQTLQGGLPR